MEKFPKDIENIIIQYATDMSLLELCPEPQMPRGCILPLNFETIMGFQSTLADMMLIHIIDAVSETNPKTLTNLFINSKLAEVIDFPLNFVNDFELSCQIYSQRCELYGIQSNELCPRWVNTLPYMLIEFMACWDVDLLQKRLAKWMDRTKDIQVRPEYPFLMMFQ